jgi:hypothetical protein
MNQISTPLRFGAIEVRSYRAEWPGALQLGLSGEDRLPGLSDVVEFSTLPNRRDRVFLWDMNQPLKAPLNPNKQTHGNPRKVLTVEALETLLKPLLYKILKKQYTFSRQAHGGIPVKSTDKPYQIPPTWPRKDAPADVQENALYLLQAIVEIKAKASGQPLPSEDASGTAG